MHQPKNILVVDADPVWRDRMVEALASPRLVVSAVETGTEALEHARREKPDVVVIELALPGLTGLGLTRALREDAALHAVGIVMVTDHSKEQDRVLAFECGVDDFLAKPFYGRELASRVLAVLRRSGPPSIAHGPLDGIPRGMVAVRPSDASVLVNGERVDLTPREFDLLSSLLRHAGRVVTRRQLLIDAWGDDAAQTDRLVDAHVKAIRRKLGPAKSCVETVRGVGYRFTDLVDGD